MDARTWQVNNDAPQAFADGTFTDGAKMISFRQHMDSDSSTSTLVDNFKIVKLIEGSLDGIKVNGYTFKDEEGTKLSTVPQSGSIVADIDLQIGENVPEEIYAIIAVYSSNEELLDVRVERVSIAENDEKKNINLTINASEDTDKCKVFFWNDEIQPLTDALSLPNN